MYQMNSYGCCSQALLFPRYQVPLLLDFFKRKGKGPRDSLIEDYADELGLSRWALPLVSFSILGPGGPSGSVLERWLDPDGEDVELPV
jgi:hypothetical protein